MFSLKGSKVVHTMITLLTWTLAFAVVHSSPVPAHQLFSPTEPVLIPRSPVSADAFADNWPTNVVMLGGSETYGMWVPQDGQWHDVGSINCLDDPAYNVVDCGTVTIDNIGVVNGYGPCTFVGSNGWSASLSGNSSAGYQTVGPPQTISMVWCAT